MKRRNSLDIDKIPSRHLWYLIGLIASDGCLSPDGRHIDITSKDYRFLHSLKKAIGIKNIIGVKYGCREKNSKAYRIQIGDKSFYEFLLSIGLKTRKSLDLGEVKIPRDRFEDFLRGLIDGDGSIRKWIHPSNRCEQWSLRIYSGSKNFIKWLESNIKDIIKVKGRIHYAGDIKDRCYVLKYCKMATRMIVKKCYYSDSFGMPRKSILANKCINSRIGWRKSKTVLV